MAMHSSPGSAKHEPFSLAAIAATLIVSVLAMALLAACNFPLTFGDDYRDSSINFIADRVLTTPPAATIDELTLPLDTLALWDWGWRAQTGNDYQYMTAVELAPGTGPGGSGNAWLLEAVNLAVNPTFVADTAGWAPGNGAVISRDLAIHGNTLRIDPGLFSGYASIIPIGFFDDLAAPTLSHAYTLSLNAAGSLGLSGLKFIETDVLPYPQDLLQPAGWIGSGPFSISISGVAAPYTHTLAFTHTEAHFQFDDISAIRTDVLPTKWSLVLRLGLADTEPALVPGIYEFSVYVRRPPSHTFSTDPARGDSPDYAARFVTLRLTQTSGGIVQTVAVQSFDISALPDTWNRLALRMPSGSNFTFPESTTGGAIELSISPMNPSFPEAGAVLIANPSLHFYIDGY